MPEKTLAQIDAELEKEFNLDVVEEEVVVEDDLQVEFVDDEGEDQTLEEKPVVTQPKQQELPPKQEPDKQEFAWKEMRTKNKELEDKLREKDQYVSKFEKMAKELGYDSAEQLIKRFEEEEVEKEAKAKNVDPTFYKEFRKMQDELESTKREKIERERNSRILDFSKSLDELAQENGLNDQEKQKIIQELEQDGYTVEDIIAIKSPKKLLAGYIVDRIAERKVQSKLKKEKTDFEDEKHTGKQEVTLDDLDKQIQDEIKQYAKQQGYKL